MRILVVDDEPAVREAVERALRLDGHDVLLGRRRRRGARQARRRAPGAVVLDVLMPRADGVELRRRMRLRSGRRPF